MSLTHQQIAEKKLEFEKRCSQLRENIYHWRTNEVEYENIKDSIAALDEDSPQQNIIDAARKSSGSVVTDNDALELTGAQQGIARSRDQVLSALSRRLDYVRRNINQLERQMTTAQLNIEGLEKIGHDVPEEMGFDDDQLPVTEIVEELDEDGNVIKGSTKLPEHEAVNSKLFERFAELGVLPEDESSKHQSDKAPKSKGGETSVVEVPEKPRESASNLAQSNQSIQLPETPSHATNTPATQDPQRQDGHNAPDSHVSTDTVKTKSAPEPNTERKDNGFDKEAIFQIDESPEEAELRREIMQYSLEEVGAIVGELDLEETGSQSSFDDGDEDDDFDFDDDDYEPEEDEHGLSKDMVLSNKYLQKMRTLEEKYSARGLQNVGSDPDNLPEEVREQIQDANGDTSPNGTDMKTSSSLGHLNGESSRDNLTTSDSMLESSLKSPSRDKSTKKKVAFADSVDVAPSNSGGAKPPPKNPSSTAPVIARDSIIERTSDPSQAPPPPAPTKRSVSRFKSARQAPELTSEKYTVTESPSGKKTVDSPSMSSDRTQEQQQQQKQPLLGNLVEHEAAHEEALPPDPDEIDENIHRQEILNEYYRMRNRKIQEQGGFSQVAEEGPIVPLDDSDGEGDPQRPTRKVSRFKAARLRNQ